MSKYLADVIIVGSGITGTSAAYYCAKKGLSCIVVEKRIIGDGGSSRNGGGVRQSGRGEWDMPMAQFAVNHIWPNMKDELGVDPEYKQTGYLIFGFNEDHKKRIEDRIALSHQYGLQMDFIKKEDIKEINPYASDMVKYAGWTPTDGRANPLKASLAFYKRSRELGVRYFTNDSIVKIVTIQGKARQVIGESGNVYEGDKIIIAAGYEGRAILQTVGVDVPITQRSQDVIITEKIPPLFEHVVGGIDGFYGHQTNDGTFVFGHNNPITRFHPFADNSYSSTFNIAYVCDTIGQYFPTLKSLKTVRSWSGFTDVTPDGVPLMGNINAVPGLMVFIGSNGTGFCLGPSVGYTLAELAADQKPTINIEKMDPTRFEYSKLALPPF